MPGYLADRTAQTRSRNREGYASCRNTNLIFGPRIVTVCFPRLLQLLFCRRYDDRGQRTLQDAFGECNCKTGNPLNVRIASRLLKIT